MALILLPVLWIVIPSISVPSGAVPVYRQEQYEVCQTAVCQETAQSLLDSMNTSVDPCQDFYQYSCGGWVNRHPIPEEKFRYSTFDVLYDQVLDTTGEILQNAANEVHPRAVIEAATLYKGCVDKEARDRKGLGQMRDLLESLGGWPMASAQWDDSGYQWQTQVAFIRRIHSINPIIALSVEPDANHTSQHMIKLDQPDFGLGRNQLVNLTSLSERDRELVAAYRAYIVATAQLMNPNVDQTQVGNEADDIIAFESRLAQFSKPPEERRDASSWYHKMSLSRVQEITENTYFEWTDFLRNVLPGFPEVPVETEVILAEIDYVKNTVSLAHGTNPRILANYIGWRLLMTMGRHTTSQFRENHFQFEKVVMGIQRQERLERICTQDTVDLLGYAAGRLYVDKYFSEESKQDVDNLVENIRSAYEATLRNNTWLDPATKNKAIDKLEAMITKMGYPQWIKNDNELNEYYSTVQNVRDDEYFASLVEVNRAMTAIDLAKWNQPTDRVHDWGVAPPVVNAFYSPDSNSMIFPAGILNPPFFKHGRTDALNFGGIGTIIGHEISHGFDDEGSQYDPEGNLVNWWSQETKDTFNRKADCFRNQYSSHVEPTTKKNLNGNNTVGENIADNGALRNSLIAYRMHVLNSGNSDSVINKRLPGVPATPEQLFFLGYSTMWCGTERKESLEWIIQYDSHTPNEFRALIPFMNSRDFAEAFNCPSGSPMNPVDKCQLW